MKFSFRDIDSGDFYTIEFIRRSRWHTWFRKPAHFEMFIVSRPDCRFEMGMKAHLYEYERICIASGYEPRTLERAKALAMHWIRGFSIYRRTGQFPNGAVRVNVADR